MSPFGVPLSVFIFFLTVWSIFDVGFAFPVNVWPYPTFVDWPHPQAIRLSTGFTISSSGHRYLDSAVRRYHKQILLDKYSPFIPPPLNLTSSPALKHLTITISDADAPLAHGVDESYHLSVPCNGEAAALAAVTAWGAMRGLETFSQLAYSTKPKRVACGVNISDAPLFGHRGILLDTSRNFYELEDLLRLVDAMSMNKLNVFHWHISDSQSFPLVVPSAEELSAKGAYSPQMIYSPEDVAELIEYATERGVRVVPEIDMPAHSLSWAKAYPEIVTCANDFWWPAGVDWSDRFASEPGAGQLNPLIPETYQVVENVLRGVVSMFPDEFYHAGGDEVVPNCWKTDPAIQTFLTKSKNSTLSQLLELFVNSTLPTILSLNRSIVYWEDIILDDEIRVNPSFLPRENVVLQTWNNGPSNTKRIVGLGYRTIVSSSEYYYLDCGHGGWVGNDSQYDRPSEGTAGGSWCAPFKTWQTIYDYDIRQGLSVAEAKLVLGGEVALWSEQADPTVMDSRIWPRAAALAEALWSGNRDKQGRKRYAEATDRLNQWRYRMVKRGIAAEPIQPLWCITNPGMCNLVNSE